MHVEYNNTDFNQTFIFTKSSNKFKKSDLLLILGGFIFLLNVINYFIEINSFIEIQDDYKEEILYKALLNKSILYEHHFTSSKSSLSECSKFVNNQTLTLHLEYIDKYSSNKYTIYYLTLGDLYTSLFMLISLFFLIKINWMSYKKFFKKLSLFCALCFFIFEYASLIIYISIYLKIYKIYELYNEVSIKQCIDNQIENSQINELLFNDMLMNFIHDLKFIYSSSIIIIIIQFVCITIILYKIKLLITINLITNNDSLFNETSAYEHTNFYFHTNKKKTNNSEDYFVNSKYEDKLK